MASIDKMTTEELIKISKKKLKEDEDYLTELKKKLKEEKNE